MKVVLASANPGKLREFQNILSHHDFELVNQSALGISEVIENGKTFEENALIKARHASRESGLPSIADDSGLCVNYLNGEPGIYSARYAGENATDSDNLKKLLEKLIDVPVTQRMAHFHCTIAMVNSYDDSSPLICNGKWYGHITETPIGSNGFGYDPVFFIPELKCTSAELTPEIKNKYSHRGITLKNLLTQLM